MLPARFVAENLGAKVEWDGEKELVTITGKNLKTDENVTILITIGAATSKVNGQEIKLDSPAFIENDRKLGNKRRMGGKGAEGNYHKARNQKG